jgi:glucose/arabinose dehydrogenase
MVTMRYRATAAVADGVRSLLTRLQRGGRCFESSSLAHGDSIGRLRLTALMITLLALAVVPQVSAVTLPPGFSEKTVFTGLSQPTAVRFSPDGRVFVAEKSGMIKEFESLTDTTPRVYADLRSNVHDYWDRGLLGLALDPSFPTKNVIYALYTHDAPIGGTAPVYNDTCADPTGAGCKVSGRLSRILFDGSEQVMIEDWCQQYPSHSIGSLAFGPDGNLYVSGGDGASFNWVDYGQGGGSLNRCVDPASEGGALRSQDMRTTSDPVTLDGALLRVDPDTGAGAAGNPFASSTDANARRIIAYGLRNPFRITFRPGTSELWAGDVGWNEWEEINRVTNATDATAENFGWPCYEGDLRQPGYDAQNLTICETLYGQGNAVTAPYYAYRHSDHVIPGESCPVGGSAIAGLSFAFYSGGPYPPEYDGALFFADYTRKCIWAMEKGGTILPSPSNIKGFVGGAANPVDVQVGPDGMLYYVDIGGGSIRRIAYTAAANQPPVAVAKANPTSGDVGMTVSFDGSASSDPNGDPLSYAWDLDGDGAFDDSTAATTTRTYNAAGTFRVSLQVSDGKGGTATDAVTVSVGLPKVTISSPPTSLRWTVGDTISFSGSATDNQGAEIPSSNLTWNLVLKHGACPDCHDHFLQTYSGVNSGSFNAPDHDYPSELELTLTATDAAGLRNSTSIRLLPRTTTLTFQTSPTGLKLTFNGVNATAPFSRTVIVASSNSLSAPSPQTLRGKQVFRSWSDGVTTANRTIVAPASAVTYTATFSKK